MVMSFWERDYLGLLPRPQLVQVISPELHHDSPLVQKLSSVVSSAQGVGHPVGKLMFDDLGREVEPLVKKGPCRGPEAVACYVVFGGEAHGLKGPVYGHVGYRPTLSGQACKYPGGGSRERLEILEDLHSLSGKWHQMLLLGLGDRKAPFSSLHVDLIPFHVSYFPGPLEGIDQGLERCSDYEAPLICPDGP